MSKTDKWKNRRQTLEKLRNKLEEAKSEVDGLAGERRSAVNRLKGKFNISTLKEAKTLGIRLQRKEGTFVSDLIEYVDELEEEIGV